MKNNSYYRLISEALFFKPNNWQDKTEISSSNGINYESKQIQCPSALFFYLYIKFIQCWKTVNICIVFFKRPSLKVRYGLDLPKF